MLTRPNPTGDGRQDREATRQYRRLEVVVLSGRGLGTKGGRWKVQLTLQSAGDLFGEGYGAKVSPWTEATVSSPCVKFGAGGLRATFPLTTSMGAPAAVNDPRFPDTAVLCVKLLVSSSAASTAAKLLPGAVVAELDEATSRLEARTKYSLRNLLSGRVQYSSSQIFQGWMLLEPEGESTVNSPALWMQIYVLPDHESSAVSLNAELDKAAEEVFASEIAASTPPAQMPSVSVPLPQSGLKGSGSRHRNSSPAKSVDLMDIMMHTEPVQSPPVKLGETKPQTLDILDSLAGLSFDGGGEGQQPSPMMMSPTPSASAFSFINESVPVDSTFQPVGPGINSHNPVISPTTSTSFEVVVPRSPFGFNSGLTNFGSTNWAALSSPSLVRSTSCSNPNDAQSASQSGSATILSGSPVASGRPVELLEGLEQSMLNDLGRSLRS